MVKLTLFAAGAALVLISQSAAAGVCDYKPSKLIGTGGSVAVAAGSGAVAGAAGALKATGIYTLTHAASGAAMLGSTAGGVSAAGTVGIMGGTAGAGAAVVAVVLNPLVWVPAAVTAVGATGLEGFCYITGK